MEGAGFAKEKISERHDKWEVVINKALQDEASRMKLPLWPWNPYLEEYQIKNFNDDELLKAQNIAEYDNEFSYNTFASTLRKVTSNYFNEVRLNRYNIYVYNLLGKV